MNSMDRYRTCFCSILSLEDDFDENLIEFGNTPDWDSVGHMELVTTIEDEFGIMFDPKDILEFKSFSDGINILEKNGIKL